MSSLKESFRHRNISGRKSVRTALLAECVYGDRDGDDRHGNQPEYGLDCSVMHPGGGLWA